MLVARRASSRIFAVLARQLSFYDMAKKVMPKLSDTERAALDAGTIGFDRDLFAGSPLLSSLNKYEAVLTSEEKDFLEKQVTEVGDMADDYIITKDRDMPLPIWNYLKKNGFFGLIIPKKFGGKGFSAHAHSQVLLKLATASGTLAATVSVPNSLGPGELLMRYGTDKQKNYYLPKLASGEMIPCFGLTAPHSGSDAASMIGSDGIVVERDGKIGIVASFKKRYITLAPVAGVAGIAFLLKDPNKLLKGVGHEGITIALLERHHPGLRMGARHDPLYAAFMNGPVEGDDVFIPMENIMGGQERCGFGWNMLMDCLAEGRSISLPASATAATKAVTVGVGAYARIRKQFRVPVAEMGGIQEHIARIASNAVICSAGQHLINGMLGKHEQPAVLSAVMKLETTRRARESMIDGMDILGGSGICRGPSNMLGNGYMAAPIAITVEGANTLTRCMIVFGQGLTRSHPHMYDMIKTLENGNDAAGFNRELKNFITHLSSNSASAFIRAFTRPRSKSGGIVAYYEGQLSRFSADFATTVDLALTLGGKLKFEEMLSGRFADVLSRLYLGYATLWYYNNHSKVNGLEQVVDHALTQLLFELQESFKGLADNFPIRPIGYLMKAICFPTGYPYHPPSDSSIKKVSHLATTPSQFRELMSENLFVSSRSDNKVKMLMVAFGKTVEADEIRAKIKKEKRSATDAEAALLKEVDGLVDQLVQVDVFDRLGMEEFAGPDYIRPALIGTAYEAGERDKLRAKVTVAAKVQQQARK